ncbi:MAG TPA: metallophosphoesterase [Pyrinomonadaceae bacterium]|nr:metallophosphoesterase [Pyrinomonadaceae bacterium]
MNYIIVSDLHIGGNTDLDIFNSQAQLASFLASLGDGPQTLIINGDFIDFLAVEPFGSFNRKAAQDKIKKIIAAAPNQEVWKAFRDFLQAHPQNGIDILLGNHDVEMVFDEVQTDLRQVMAGPDDGKRLQFLFDRLSYPRLVVGGVHVHVEHGFQYDRFNWYDHNKLIRATENNQDGANFELPVGSRLVYKVLNRLTRNHPFMPLLKPEAAAFWMLAALAPEEIFRHGGSTALIGSSTLKATLRKYLRDTQLGADDAAGPGAALTPLQAQLADMLFDEGLTDETVNDVEEFLDNGTGDERPAEGVTFAASPILRGKLFFVRRALKSLKYERDTFFDSTQRDEFEGALNKILASGAKVAVFGHSHGRKMLSLFKEDEAPGTDLLHLKRPSLLYVNTGTWANLLDFDLSLLSDDEKAQQWLDDLEAGSFQPTLIYTYARLEELPGGRGARVSLEEWRDGQTHMVEPPREISP